MLNRGGAALQKGVTLIEIMMALVVLGVLLGLGIPIYAQWIQNTQIRTAGESALGAIQLARIEALKRNTNVSFQLMTTMDASCAPSATGTSWVVSVNDATGKCDVTDPSLPPLIIQGKSPSEGTKNVTFTASQAVIAFSGLGLVTPAPANDITIDLKNPTNGATCVATGGDMRCLRLVVTGSGQVRLCDPAVSTSGDPRKC